MSKEKGKTQNEKRKLTRQEKKQIDALIRQAKGDGKPHTAQDSIPFERMYKDGICRLANGRYSKCIEFEDINYQLAQPDDKTAIFEALCDMYNSFDASIGVQLSLISRHANKEDFKNSITIAPQNDDFDSIRAEYTEMLQTQLERGNNGLIKTKFDGVVLLADTGGKYVKKGEKGIKIFAPAPYKVKKLVDKLDPETRKPMLDREGKAVKEEKEITVPAFKVITVFDISQTEGKEFPDLSVKPLLADVEQYEDFFAALEKASPVPIAFEQITNGANGYFSLTDKRIAIKEGVSELQAVKTAIHEIAHAKLHDVDLNAPPEQQNRVDRHTREVEAESVAYTVCQHFGLDTSDYSFGYVAGWSSGKEMTELKASLETIQATAKELITEIEGHFTELQQQRQAEQEQQTPVFDKLPPEQQQALSDTVKNTLQMLVDADKRIYGDVTGKTLEAIAAQGYSYKDGQLEKQQPEATPESLLTGETVRTPRGNFHITDMSREQIEAAGFGFHHASEDGKYLIMGNGTQAYAIAAEQPQRDNPLKHVEDTIEQNDNNFDGIINNTPQAPTVADLEQRVKAGEAISVTDLAKAVKAEKREQPQKKPSILKKLDEYKKQAAQQPKDKQKEQKKDLEV